MSEDRPARPWDIFKAQNRITPQYVIDARMEICRACPEFLKPIQTCNVCKCVMPVKTTLNNAGCPIHKWEAITFSISEVNSIHDDGLPRKG